MATHYKGDEIPALTAGYDSTAQRFEVAPDDLRYARLVAAAHARVRFKEIEMDGAMTGHIDVLAPHFDDPVADPAAISLFRLARASTTKVLISGTGGEELFAGYPRHHHLGVAALVGRAPKVSHSLASKFAPALPAGRPGPYALRRHGQKLARALGTHGIPHYRRMVAQLTFAELDALMPGNAADAFAERDAQSPSLTSITLSEALSFDLGQFLPNLNLAYVDKASMAAGIEVRVPLLDEAVFNLAATSNPSDFIAGGKPKACLRRAAESLVPAPVLHREKTGFGAPVRSWFRFDRRNELRERIAALETTGLVDTKVALDLVGKVVRGYLDASLAAVGPCLP